MTVHQLHEMLSDLDDTRELVFEAPHTDDDQDDPLVLAWRAAACRAARALNAWRSRGGVEAYVTYRALADQADAAQDALWAGAALRLLTT
jgi:hypothetical protein